MASVTLAQSALLCQNELISGVIESIVTADQFYQVLPFMGIEGNALAYNREKTMGGVQAAEVGTAIVAGKTAAEFAQVTATLTTLVGDAEVNGLIQATRSNINDQKAVQIVSKAKNIGVEYRKRLINGTGTAPDFSGLLTLCAASQKITTGTVDTAADYTFEHLDELMDKVMDKGGQVDYMQMTSKSLRRYYKMLRELGGASIGDVVTLPSGIEVPGYRGTPIFRNDNIPSNLGTGSNSTAIIAGTLDDGTGKYGISGLTVEGPNFGVHVEEVGISETKDETITRVKMYCGLALFSELGLAVLTDVK